MHLSGRGSFYRRGHREVQIHPLANLCALRDLGGGSHRSGIPIEHTHILRALLNGCLNSVTTRIFRLAAEELALGMARRQFGGALISGTGFGGLAEFHQKTGADGVIKVLRLK